MEKNWLIRLVNKFVLILFLLSLVLLVWRWGSLPPRVPLWYSRPWGNDQLVEPYWLILLPVSSIAWYGINWAVAKYIAREYLVFCQMLYVSSLIVSLLSFFALTKILFLIT